jgi:hypothetical protein
VHDVRGLPPNAIAHVEVPAPANPHLPFIKGLPADQDDPLYASVKMYPGPPPKAKAAVFVPAPAKKDLAVIIALPADQVDIP